MLRTQETLSLGCCRYKQQRLLPVSARHELTWFDELNGAFDVQKAVPASWMKAGSHQIFVSLLMEVVPVDVEAKQHRSTQTRRFCARDTSYVDGRIGESVFTTSLFMPRGTN